MGDLAETDTLGRRAAGGLAELGPEAMAEAMGIIEAKASAAQPQPMDGGGNQVFAHLGLLAIEFRLVGLVEKTAVVVGPGAKAQPGAGGGIGRQQGLLEGRMLIRNMVGDGNPARSAGPAAGSCPLALPRHPAPPSSGAITKKALTA